MEYTASMRRKALVVYGALVAMLLLSVILYSVYLSWRQPTADAVLESDWSQFRSEQDSLARLLAAQNPTVKPVNHYAVLSQPLRP